MTIIVYKDGVMAADRTSKGNGVNFYALSKVHRSVDGHGSVFLVGCSGPVSVGAAFLRAVQDCTTASFKTDAKDFNAILVGRKLSGEISAFEFDEHGWFAVPYKPFLCVGSGAEIAMGALDFGASAEQAARIASARIGSGLDGIDVVSFDQE